MSHYYYDSDSSSGFPGQGFRGWVVRPGNLDYAQTCKLPNTRLQNKPALVARCQNVNDILMAVEYCRINDEPIAIRGGGYDINGDGLPDGAFVIDTTLMKKIKIDSHLQTVTVEAGVLIGEMDQATQAYGLVVPSGATSQGGIAGLTLGGGSGFLTRRFGLAVDNLLSIDVVTIDGRRITASETQNMELFWGLRGAGHNLAIATSFTFQAQKLGPRVNSGMLIYPIHVAVSVLSRIDDVMAAAPRELTIYPVILPGPPTSLSSQVRAPADTPVLMLIVVFTGDPGRYEHAMAGIRSLAQPLADTVRPTTWVETNVMLDKLAPSDRRQHSHSAYLPSITPEIAQTTVNWVMDSPVPSTPGPSVVIVFPCLGGAIFDFDEGSAACSRASANWMCVANGQWHEPGQDDEYDSWVNGVMNALKPYSLPNGNVNMATDRGPLWLRNLYGSAQKWERLCHLKAEYDPKNLLSYNKNITRAQMALVQARSHTKMSQMRDQRKKKTVVGGLTYKLGAFHRWVVREFIPH